MVNTQGNSGHACHRKFFFCPDWPIYGMRAILFDSTVKQMAFFFRFILPYFARVYR